MNNNDTLRTRDLIATRVNPIDDARVDIDRARRKFEKRDREARRHVQHHIYNTMDKNKLKAAIAIVVGAIVQLLRLFGVVDLPDVVVDALTAVLAFIAGLFLPQPKQDNG